MLTIKSGNPLKRKIDALIVPVCEDKKIHSDKALADMVASVKKLKEFTGAASDEIVLYDVPGAAAKRLIFRGLGKAGDVTPEKFRELAGGVLTGGIKKKFKKVAFVAPESKTIKPGAKDILQALLEGACLSNYVFDKYLSEKKLKPLEGIEVFTSTKAAKEYSYLAGRVESICKGTHLAREWVSNPANAKTPEQYVDMLKNVFSKTDIKFSVLNEKELKKLGCGSLLSVAQGSKSSAFIAIADYHPEGAKKTVALVGKGVTFDSGGLDLKPADGMRTMKCDMAGSATVAATLFAMNSVRPDTRVIGVMPIVENMPSGDALRPGDIVTSYSGKTIEIGNTDAEGRLILVDALSYTEKTYKPDVTIDVATLTGACVIALGEKIAGVFSFNDKLARKIVKAGQDTGERCWQMPMPDDYKKLLKSEFADICNMASGRYGGSITAALFLSEFIDTKNWAHIDIAGPAFSMKAGEYCAPGGTGFGVRLLCDYLTG